MDTVTPIEAPRPLPERQSPQMVPLPQRPVTKGGGAYAQNVRPRRCLTFGWSAFNPARIRSVGDGLRWLAIWLITLVRMASLTISICLRAFGPWIVGIILGSLVGLVALHFVCLSLAFIYQARGERRCMGVRWKRWHLDVLLGFFVCAHGGQLFLALCLSREGGAGVSWMLLGISILALGLIAARDPDGSEQDEQELRIGM